MVIVGKSKVNGIPLKKPTNKQGGRKLCFLIFNFLIFIKIERRFFYD